MSGVLDRLRSKKELVGIRKSPALQGAGFASMELQIAKEILCEVFEIKVSEVDEMIRLRLDKQPVWSRSVLTIGLHRFLKDLICRIA